MKKNEPEKTEDQNSQPTTIRGTIQAASSAPHNEKDAEKEEQASHSVKVKEWGPDSLEIHGPGSVSLRQIWDGGAILGVLASERIKSGSWRTFWSK